MAKCKALTGSAAKGLTCLDNKWSVACHVAFGFASKNRVKLDSLCWFSQRRRNAIFYWGEGVHHDPHIRTRPRFLYNAPTPKFYHHNYVDSFGIYHVDKQTNRRRWKHPTLFATLRRWVTIAAYEYCGWSPTVITARVGLDWRACEMLLNA